MRFSVRDLFLVTMIVALALGWWLEHRRLEKEIEQLRTPFGLTPNGTPTPTLSLEFRWKGDDNWRKEFHPTFDIPPAPSLPKP